MGQRAVGRHAKQIRRASHIVGSIGVVGVAKIGRQQGQQRLHVGVLSMPCGEPCDGETMPQIMRS